MKLEFNPSSQLRGSSAKLSVSLQAAQRQQIESQLEDRTTLSSNLPQEEQAPVSLTAGNILQAVDTATRAINDVAELRSKQKALAEQGYNLPEITKQHTDLVQEFQTLQTEIDRIQSAATYNGTDLVSGSSTFELIDSNKSVNEVIALGPISSVLSSTVPFGGDSQATSIGITTRSRSYVALSGLEDHQATISAVQADRSAASSKADGLAKREATPDINVTKVKEVEITESEAVELAQQIARKLKASSRAPQVAETLIAASAEKLDPEKVKSLLE